MLRLATFLGRKIVAPFSRSGLSDSFNQKLKAKELTGQTIQASIRTILQVQFSRFESYPNFMGFLAYLASSQRYA